MASPYTISVVCTGNICRSPMGEVMLRDAFDRAGLENVVIESAGTGDWHVGGGADHRAEEIIADNGLDLSGHRRRSSTARISNAWISSSPWTILICVPCARS